MEIFNIDSYSDAYLSEMYGHEKTNDTVCVNICNIYTITFSDFTVLWKQNAQTEIAPLTMEAEIVDFAHNCR